MSMTSGSSIQCLLGGCDCARLRQRSGEALANADESLHQSVHYPGISILIKTQPR